LREEQERLRSSRNLQTFWLYNLGFQKKGLPFPFPIYSSSFQKSFSISKFEKTFEVTRKNERDYKETLRKYSFRKPRREAGFSEQVNPISIFRFAGRPTKGQFATTIRITVTSRGAYLGVDSRKSSYS
jgi:hypothetical protein